MKDNKPVTSMQLSSQLKKGEPAKRESGIPYGGIQKEFYLHHSCIILQ
jgi:hypothetical protein